ncbi:MAG: hypothetical protein J7K72_04615 [Candidatus Aenigmarchaeota archaeon]|nr:hypothetical protein [Candidatus Aenigmarchaeota archaeon]
MAIKADEFKTAFNKLKEYLGVLYEDIDRLDEYGDPRLKEANKSYKSALMELESQMKNYIYNAKTEEESKNIIVNLSANMYALVDPETDSSDLVNVLYLKKFPREHFKNVSNILKEYFLNEALIAKIKEDVEREKEQRKAA